MDRQGTEDRPPLPSQLLLSGVLQSTVQAREMLDDLYQEALPYISAPLDVPPKQLSVDRISNNWSQPPGEIEPDNRNNISDSGATTEPLAHEELENLPYWYRAQQVGKSLKICHVEKVWQKNKHVHRVLYVVETYLPDNWLPENARLQLRKQEEKQIREEVERKKEEKQQRKEL
ncbi:predicted protein [Histoplasma mississippiense (nom. inval.)]|uniref:predicted protein n=1 Tax=Ajellomyces capsulatus (strain NAm1 / WU24) TaxID=2059318 RepID=UPI000157C02E|nr:predicted protein [Histoplasma mississippiense (nom. inval.)]EDN06622.1 predicted protein [Histoplasma mississippiense (nom. inval.)]